MIDPREHLVQALRGPSEPDWSLFETPKNPALSAPLPPPLPEGVSLPDLHRACLEHGLDKGAAFWELFPDGEPAPPTPAESAWPLPPWDEQTRARHRAQVRRDRLECIRTQVLLDRIRGRRTVVGSMPPAKGAKPCGS